MASVDAGSIYADVRISLDKLSSDISSVKSKFNSMGTAVEDRNEQTEKSFDSLGLAGVAAIAGITVAFKSAISTFATTQQSLANVKAVSNATAAEFAQLEAAAEEAGTTTRFTASEAADALYNLASAGLDATQSVSALDGVLALAGATGSDLATASAAVTATLSQFSLEADQAGVVSNVFAAAISNSQATLEKMKSSLTTVGPVAGALGIELEEVTGSLQALYNAGYKGETAGTALKTSLAYLADGSSTTVTSLNKLGVAFEDINPEEVGLTGALEALEEAGLSTADVLSAFGTEAGPAVVSLLSAGTKAIEEYTDAVTDTDEAARQYAVQNDTLAGSFDAFTSAAEGASNSLVSNLEPVFRTILDLSSSVLKAIASLPGWLSGIATGAGSAAVGFLALSKALTLVGVSLGTGPLGLVTLAGAAVVGLISLNSKMQDSKDRTDELAAVTADLVTISDEYNGVTKELEENMGTLSAKEKAILESRQALLGLKLEEKLAEYATEYEKYNEQVERESAALDALKSSQEENLAYNEKLETQDERIAELKETIIELEKKVASGSATAAETIKLTALNQAYQATIDSEEERIATKERYKDAINDEITATEQSLATAKAAFAETQLAGEESILAFAKAFNEGSISIETYRISNEDLYNQIVQTAAGLRDVKTEMDNTTDSLDKNEDKVESSIASWKDYLKTILGVDATGTGAEIAEEFLAGFDRELEASKTVETALNGSLDEWDPSSLLESKISTIEGALTDLFSIDPSTIDSAFETTDSSVQLLVDSLKEAQDQLKLYASGDDVIDTLEEFEEEWADTINGMQDDMTDSQNESIRTQLDNLEENRDKQLEILEQEKADALATADELGASRLSIAEYYDSKITDVEQTYSDARKEIRDLELTYAASFIGALSDLLYEFADDNYAAAIAYKALAISQATISTYLAANEALAEVVYPLNFVAAGTVVAAGLANVASIATTDVSAAEGGIIMPSDGGTIAQVAENGSPELLLNGGSSGAAVMETFAASIANKMSSSTGNSSSSTNVSVSLNMDSTAMAKKLVKVVNTGAAGQISSKRAIS